MIGQATAAAVNSRRRPGHHPLKGKRTMVEHNPTLNPSTNNTLTRRAALAGTAACGALALPAMPALAAIELPGGEDPHVGWWAEMVEIRAEQDATDEFDDDVSARESELEKLIGRTPPTTPEGAAIIAAMIIAGHKMMYPDGRGMDWIEPEDRAGDTLARHLLAATPADVLRRAGLATA
jgi:hypothetical protein